MSRTHILALIMVAFVLTAYGSTSYRWVPQAIAQSNGNMEVTFECLDVGVRVNIYNPITFSCVAEGSKVAEALTEEGIRTVVRAGLFGSESTYSNIIEHKFIEGGRASYIVVEDQDGNIIIYAFFRSDDPTNIGPRYWSAELYIPRYLWNDSLGTVLYYDNTLELPFGTTVEVTIG